MKHTYFKSIIAIGAATLMLSATSCKRLADFGDDNVNPLGSTQPITAALLSNAEADLGEITTGLLASRGVPIRAGLYCQYYSETQYPDASLYQEPKFDATTVYSGVLNDLQVIINKNTDPATAAGATNSGSNANQIAIAKILKTYIAWTITDRWGDVPYSEALQGAGNFYPKYDKQEDIYKAFLQDLRDAVAGFDGGAAMKGDIIYGGNNSKWQRFANSLSMTIAMRMSKIYPNPGDYAATQFALAANDANGIIESNSDNFTLPFPGGSFKNTWQQTFESRSDYFFCKTMGDALTNLGDARFSAYSSQGNPMPYGLNTANANLFAGTAPYDTVLNVRFRTEGAAMVIYPAAASLLAKAEGIERGWISGDAESAYNAGVTASFAQWGVTMSPNYLTTGPANYNTGAGGGSIGQSAFGSIPASSNANTTTKLQRIALQNWIAYFGNGIQGWSEWRRTGVPNLQPTTFGTNNPKEIPRRYVYGASEYSLNPTSLQAAVDRLTGGDVMNSRIWWDKQ